MYGSNILYQLAVRCLLLPWRGCGLRRSGMGRLQLAVSVSMATEARRRGAQWLTVPGRASFFHGCSSPRVRGGVRSRAGHAGTLRLALAAAALPCPAAAAWLAPMIDVRVRPDRARPALIPASPPLLHLESSSAAFLREKYTRTCTGKPFPKLCNIYIMY